MKSKRLSRSLPEKLLKAVHSFYLVKIFAGEYISIFKKRHLFNHVELSEGEEDAIQQVWQRNYNKKISTRWHRLYQSYNGKFNKFYFPEALFTLKLERKLNNREIARVLSDKSMLPIYYQTLEDVRMPDTYLINNSGIFYTGNRRIIERNTAERIIENIGEVIIKPTLDSSSGDSVTLCDFYGGVDQHSGKTVNEILKFYKENYIIQEKIIPCKELEKLYPYSINTLRVITYIVGNKVEHAPITLSMGRNGNHVDNIQAGGVSVAVTDQGVLNSNGFTHYKEVYKCHPDTGTVFENHTLPEIEKLISTAKIMHEKTPHMRMISWDFTLDVQNRIVLLEFNLSGQSVWFPQMVSGKAVFGKNTERMIRLISK